MRSLHDGPHVIEIVDESTLSAEMKAAGLTGHRAVMVVVGGASGLVGESERVARRLVEQVIVPVAIEQQAVLLDGGTDSGIMALVGRAHHAARTTLPLVGVAAAPLVRRPDRPPEDPAGTAADPERHHTHLLLVPGTQWGDESRWLSAAAQAANAGGCGATVLVNGGKISLRDVAYSVAAKRPVLVVAGSGRAADQLAAELSSRDLQAPKFPEFDVLAAAQEGLLHVLDASSSHDKQRALLTRVLLG